MEIQAEAELGQAQVKLKIMVKAVVKVEDDVSNVCR